MKFTLPSKARIAAYIFTAVGTPVVAYLKVKGYIGDAETALWGAEVTVVSTLAAFNVTTTATADPADAELGEGE